MYIVKGGNEEGGRISGTTDTILPVVGETEMVAGVRTKVSSGSVSTTLVETRTVSGPLFDAILNNKYGRRAEQIRRKRRGQRLSEGPLWHWQRGSPYLEGRRGDC